MHLQTILAEQKIRIKYLLNTDVLIFPVWYLPTYTAWENYFVDSNGSFYRAPPDRSPKRLSGWISTNGYIKVQANKSHIRDFLHRIVYRAFGGPILEGWHVHHADRNRTNNAISNLVAMHPAAHRRLPRGPYQRLTEAERAMVVALWEQGQSMAAIARTFGTTAQRISNIVRRNHVARAASKAVCEVSDAIPDVGLCDADAALNARQGETSGQAYG